ncbi:unnamed protein product, partial [Amoebophrya sp. A25]
GDYLHDAHFQEAISVRRREVVHAASPLFSPAFLRLMGVCDPKKRLQEALEAALDLAHTELLACSKEAG